MEEKRGRLPPKGTLNLTNEVVTVRETLRRDHRSEQVFDAWNDDDGDGDDDGDRNRKVRVESMIIITTTTTTTTRIQADSAG